MDNLAPVTGAVLAEILDGGQSFRWEWRGDAWLGIWSDCVVRLRLDSGGRIEWSTPASLAARMTDALRVYLATATPFAEFTDRLPWRSDPHLAGCVDAFPGLRILHQPFGETLLGFLCSATKQIVQIKQMVALLAERLGAPICTSALAGKTRTFHRLPTWTELAAVPEAELRRCLLGFRARYIADTARFLAAQPDWLDQTGRLPYREAKERLCSLPGVGEKVADCVLLFGAARLEAFPVDVWILKTMAARYGLSSWKPAQLAQFGRVHFGENAGFAQQYLFSWERRTASQVRAQRRASSIPVPSHSNQSLGHERAPALESGKR